MNSGTTTAINIEVVRKRVPFSPDEPQTLGELFLKAAKKYPIDNALNYKKDGAWHAISSAEMIARIENIAAGLYSLGVSRGDRAAILAANSRSGRFLTPPASSPALSTFPSTPRSRLLRSVTSCGIPARKFCSSKTRKPGKASAKYCRNARRWKNLFFTTPPGLPTIPEFRWRNWKKPGQNSKFKTGN